MRFLLYGFLILLVLIACWSGWAYGRLVEAEHSDGPDG